MKAQSSRIHAVLRRAFSILFMVAGLMMGPPAQDRGPSLMVYDFNLGPVPASNVDHVRSLGFQGLVTRCNRLGDIPKVQAYADHTANMKGFRMLAYVNYDFNNPDSPQVWIDSLPILASLDAPLWVIVKNAPSSQDVDVLVGEMARRSEAAGVPMVLYPHWATDIEDAAEAAALMDRLDHPNLSSSLHTCHEIRAGNQSGMGAVVASHIADTELVTIAGAEKGAYAGPPPTGVHSWDDAIMPLDAGGYSLRPFLVALNDAGYTGPVILHTYGILNDPGHLGRSMDAYEDYWNSL